MTPSRSRTALVCAALTVLMLAAALVRLMLGARFATPADIAEVLTGSGRGGLRFMILEDRLPSSTAAALSGAGLGVAGGLYQRLLRNALASPDVIGIGYGASAAAVLGMLSFGLSGWALTGFSLVGAFVVAAVILVLSAGRGDAGARLILAGISIGAMLAAVVQLLMTTVDVRNAGDALRWLNGSVSDVDWGQLAVLATALLVLFAATAAVAPRLALLELGDDAARALGVRVAGARIAIVAVGAALCAAVVAVVGPLAFVALMAHPLATRALGGRGNLAVTGLLGACLVVVAELISAHLFGIGSGLPVGVLTGAIGAPFLLWLLARERSSRT